MILVDTSVWVQVFRKTRPLDLARLVPFDEIVICLPVIEEILQGFRDERCLLRGRRLGARGGPRARLRSVPSHAWGTRLGGPDGGRVGPP